MSRSGLAAGIAVALLVAAACAPAGRGAAAPAASAASGERAAGPTGGAAGGAGASAARPNPSGRTAAAMAYDPAHSTVLLFGGAASDGAALDDTWTWDGSRWTRRHAAHSPAPRTGAAVAFDGESAALVLFGGRDASGRQLSDTWRWDGDDWTELHPRSAPGARERAALAYDASIGRLVLYGGGARGAALHDTWTWGGGVWSPVTGPGPDVDTGVLVYDPRQGRVLLVSATETWAFLAGGWSNLNVAPPAACAPVAGVDDGDVAAPVVVAAAGAALNVCQWGDDAWKPAAASGAPPGRSTTHVAYDDKTSELVVFGGSTAGGQALSDTWTWTRARGWSQG